MRTSNMYACMRTSKMYACVHVYVKHVCMCACARQTCMHVCMRTSDMCACARHKCVHVCMRTLKNMHMCMCACVHVCMCACVHVCMRTSNMYACVHAHVSGITPSKIITSCMNEAHDAPHVHLPMSHFFSTLSPCPIFLDTASASCQARYAVREGVGYLRELRPVRSQQAPPLQAPRCRAPSAPRGLFRWSSRSSSPVLVVVRGDVRVGQLVSCSIITCGGVGYWGPSSINL